MPAITVIFVMLTVAAGTYDLWTYRIPNGFVLALAALFLIDALLHIHQVHWLDHVGAALACLAVGLVGYSFGWFGAGDVKLISVLALWSGFTALMAFLLLTSLGALLAMLIVLIVRAVLPRYRSAESLLALPRFLKRGEGFPYAVGVAIGAILSMRLFPAWLFH
jgi:prepilin peptidase CpaA